MDYQVTVPAIMRNALMGHPAIANFTKSWLPDSMEFIDEIPRTSTGKFLKSALRERFLSRYAAT